MGGEGRGDERHGRSRIQRTELPSLQVPGEELQLRTLPEKPHEPFEVQWLRPLELVTSTPILFQPVNVQAVTSLMNPKLLIFRTP